MPSNPVPNGGLRKTQPENSIESRVRLEILLTHGDGADLAVTVLALLRAYALDIRGLLLIDSYYGSSTPIVCWMDDIDSVAVDGIQSVLVCRSATPHVLRVPGSSSMGLPLASTYVFEGR